MERIRSIRTRIRSVFIIAELVLYICSCILFIVSNIPVDVKISVQTNKLSQFGRLPRMKLEITEMP